ncbi:hypothetical protein A5752_16980 [Mycobacterium sp. 852002-51961_SCH5331710]|nr:hypothetical protein A5752_16980 [Mycobacterium sp. 852002-51961_SCH5331710]
MSVLPLQGVENFHELVAGFVEGAGELVHIASEGFEQVIRIILGRQENRWPLRRSRMGDCASLIAIKHERKFEVWIGRARHRSSKCDEVAVAIAPHDARAFRQLLISEVQEGASERAGGLILAE